MWNNEYMWPIKVKVAYTFDAIKDGHKYKLNSNKYF
jgi:hypothetical protein